MTIVLIALCVVVAVMELVAGRQTKRQSDTFVYRIDELKAEISGQNTALSEVAAS